MTVVTMRLLLCAVVVAASVAGGEGFNLTELEPEYSGLEVAGNSSEADTGDMDSEDTEYNMVMAYGDEDQEGEGEGVDDGIRDSGRRKGDTFGSSFTNKSLTLCCVAVIGKPFIRTPPHAVTARVGGAAVLGCGAEGDPAPAISWVSSRAGRLASSGHNYEVRGDGSLAFSSVEKEDEAGYRCRARSVKQLVLQKVPSEGS